MKFIIEFFNFLRSSKKLWLLPILIVLFLGYQIVESMILVKDPNLFIDILEFLIGLLLSCIIKAGLSG